MTEERPAFMVLATDGDCSCGKARLSIYDTAEMSAELLASELTLSGPDWQPLMVEAATKREVCARCVAAYVSYSPLRPLVESQAIAMLFALIETPGAPWQEIVARATRSFAEATAAIIARGAALTQEMSDKEIAARWLALAEVAGHAGSRAERKRFEKAVRKFWDMTRRHTRAIEDLGADLYPDGAPPGMDVAEEDRQAVLETIVRPSQQRRRLMAELTDQEILAIWEKLARAAMEAEESPWIDEAEYERRRQVVTEFINASPRHKRVIEEDYARAFPEAIIDSVVRPAQRRRN